MRSFISMIFLFVLVACSSGQKNEQQKDVKNSEAAINAPYILLISLDGYRWDYNKKYGPVFLSKFANDGVSLDSLIPSFPTKTFPNHLSLVTGLYPGHHGIVDNHFYDPTLKLEYKLSDRDSVVNPGFYTGVPLWNLSQMNGMLSATYFWPGSEAPIGGRYPNYWEVYNHGAPHEDRIDKVISWLKLPPQQRPHFVTLYFHDVDSAGHHYGPNSKEVGEAITKVDQSLASLINQVNQLNLPINIIITSDHGMTEVNRDNSILLDNAFGSSEDQKLLQSFKHIGSGPIVQFYYEGEPSLKAKSVKRMQQILSKIDQRLKAYTPKSAPAKWHLAQNERMGDVFAVSKMGVFIGMKGDRLSSGNHGYDASEGKDMHAIFYAQGPAFKSKLKLHSAKNIDLYPLIAKILGLKFDHKIDGKLSGMKGALK